MTDPKRDHVSEHIERCIELYGQPIDSDFKRTVPLAHYEQVRADLLMLVGIAIALKAEPKP